MIYIRLSYNNEGIEGIAIKTNNIIIIILKNSDFWRRREDAKSIKKMDSMDKDIKDIQKNK